MIKTFKRLTTVITSMILAVTASAQTTPINVAGVYECNTSSNGLRKQMYLAVDFINGTPDLTQVFTEKENSFQKLPKDFINGKKLKRTFAGTKSAGFGKFKEKMLISNSSEFRLSNPRIVDGAIVADWTDASNGKGECTIIVNPDRSMQILGLTNFTRDLSPDDILLTLVEDRLQGAEPYVTPTPVADFLCNEYIKKCTKAKVTSFDKEIPMEVSVAKQTGTRVEFEMKLRNNSNYEKLNLVVGDDMQRRCEAETPNGKNYVDFAFKTLGPQEKEASIPAEKGKWKSFKVIIENVDEKVDFFKQVNVYFAIAGGFFVDQHYTVIENLPVLQEMPESIKPQKKAPKATASDTYRTFDVAPRTWGSVVFSKSEEGINIRKTPSKTAPRLMYDESSITNFQAPLNTYGYWSTAAQTNDRYPVSFTRGLEVGSQSGWIEILGAGPKGQSNGWVSGSLCEVLSPGIISNPTQLWQQTLRWLPVNPKDKEGEYAIYGTYDVMDQYAEFLVGKLSDGVIVAPYGLVVSAYCDNGHKPGLFKNPEGEYVLYFDSSMNCGDSMEPDLDMSKVTEAILTDIANKAMELPNPAYIFTIKGTAELYVEK